MVAKEPIAAEDNSRTDQWHHQDYYDDEEAEEALSLCDLPIYSGSLESDDHFSSSKEDYQSSLDDQDFFEFFSQDFSTASSTYTSSAEEIIFCGKLIPYKAPPVLSQEKTHKLHQINTEKQQQQQQLPKKKKSFFQWRTKSSNKSKTSKDNTSKRIINSSTSTSTNTNNIKKKKNYFEHQKKSGSTTTLALPASHKCSANKKYGYSFKKVSILASPTKSRWQLFLFGFRFPTEMELSDMRSRQHRRTRSSSTSSPSFEEADESKEVKAGRTTKGKGMWRLLRVLGCNTVVKASLGCIPRM